MKSKNTAHFSLILGMVLLAFLTACKTAKNETPESTTKLPGDVAISPSTFRCEGSVLESNSKSIHIKVTKMVEQGSSLFYSVSAGDTLLASFQTAMKTIY